MQFQPQGKPSVGIVFDADFGNTIDDALALAMLYGFQGKNEARVLSVSTTKSSLNAAIFADVLVRFYTGEPSPFFGDDSDRSLPVRQDGRRRTRCSMPSSAIQSIPATSSR